jgi:osmotically-inducible protein OsmY
MSLNDDRSPPNDWDRRSDLSGAGEHPAPRELAHGAVGRLSWDELAQQNICAALLASRSLDGHQVQVEMTAEGIVLRGTVATEEDRSRALEIARKMAGRRVVLDALSVSRTGKSGPHPPRGGSDGARTAT